MTRLGLFATWWRRLKCIHPRWIQGGLTNFQTGRREYTCAVCGKRVERTFAPIDYVDWRP